MWISLIKKFWPQIAIATLLMFSLGQFKYYNIKIDNFKSTIKSLEVQIDFKEQELVNCKGMIVNQNEKIESDSKQSAEKLKNLEDIKIILNKSQLENEKIIENLRKQKISNDCSVVELFLRNSIKDLK